MINARPSVVRNQTVITVALWTLALSAAWYVGGFIARDDLNAIAYSLIVLVICVIGMAILRNWRSGFYVFVVWLLFEDLARKYMGNSTIMFFGKDLLVGITYVSFLIAVHRGRAARFRPPFLVFFGMFLLLSAIQVFNPNSPNVLYGLLGMKVDFYYFPLIFVGYAVIQGDEDLKQFFVFNLWFASIISFLGIVQAIVGPSFLNPTTLAPELRSLSNVEREVHSTGQLVFRPSSIFVSDGRYAWYVLLMWFLAAGLLGFSLLRRGKADKIVYLALGLLTGATLLSGSRTTFVVLSTSFLVFAGAFLWGAPWKWRQSNRLVRATRRVFAFGGLGLLLLLLVFPEAIGARLDFYSETLLPRSQYSELVGRGRDYPTVEFEKAFSQPNWILGNGIGTISLSTQYVARLLGERPPSIGVESGWGNLMLELGVLGVVLWLLWTLVALLFCWKVVRSLRKTVYFPIGFAIFWFAFLLLVPFSYNGMTAYQNYIYNAYLWLLLGILFRLPILAGRPGMAQASANES
jgi:hypothetical protein